jgi:spoIIIJ-associated protein
METTTPTPPRPASVLAGVPPRDVLQKMLDTLGIPASVEDQSANDAPRLFVSTPETARLIGRRGQTIFQLQFLLNRMLQRAYPDLPKVRVDCERKQEAKPEPPPVGRFDELLKQVDATAEKVRRWGDPLVIGPYNPEERQAIVQAFDRDAELEAVGEPGEETSRKRIMLRVRGTKPRT